MKSKLLDTSGEKTYALKRSAEITSSPASMLEESPRHLVRPTDPASGLALISV